MGTDATASLSYGFIIPQPQVLKLLQKLQNSTKEIKEFNYSSGEPYELEELLKKHLEERKLGDFQMMYLTSGSEEFEGLAIVDLKVQESVVAWGMESQTFESSCEPWKDEEHIEEANKAYGRLGKDSLFNELGIDTDPEWLIGCTMSC